MKGQNVRVLDVLFIGPAMIAGGSVVYKHALGGERRALGAFLIFAGVGTIIYNANNWLEGEALRADTQARQRVAQQPQPKQAPAVTLAPKG